MLALESLKNATSLSDLANLLGYQPKALSYILYKIPTSEKYEEFKIPKKSGGERRIKAPTPQLKQLQARLAEKLNKCLDVISKQHNHKKSLSHGFRKKHSIITNASNHSNKRHVFNVDLHDFFPSINFGRVRGFFIKNAHFKLDPNVATLIAQIACHDNELPQGSPCSPVISNLIGHVLDIRMVQLAKKAKCTYSRYADDLTFSTNRRTFPEAIAVLVNEEGDEWAAGKALKKEIERSGFTINDKKTSMQHKTTRQVATGLVVNEKVNIKNEYYRQARVMCHSLFNTGAFHLGSNYKGESGNLNQLEGIVSHVYHVKRLHDDRKIGKKRHDPSAIMKLYRELLFFKHFFSLSQPLIICEGKTDITYLKSVVSG